MTDKKAVSVIRLRDSDRFVEIWDEGKKYYGGDQAWFESPIGVQGGCGTVAAANIAAYMAYNNPIYASLYPHHNLDKINFVKHMNEMLHYVTPLRIPFTDVPLGVWPAGKLESGFRRFARDKGVRVKGVHLGRTVTKQHIIEYISTGLERDAPIAMLIGCNSRLNHTEIWQPNGCSWIQQSMNLHWVVITELELDEIHDFARVKVSTWGGCCYLNLEDYIRGERIYESLLYFQ